MNHIAHENEEKMSKLLTSPFLNFFILNTETTTITSKGFERFEILDERLTMDKLSMGELIPDEFWQVKKVAVKNTGNFTKEKINELLKENFTDNLSVWVTEPNFFFLPPPYIFNENMLPSLASFFIKEKPFTDQELNLKPVNVHVHQFKLNRVLNQYTFSSLNYKFTIIDEKLEEMIFCIKNFSSPDVFVKDFFVLEPLIFQLNQLFQKEETNQLLQGTSLIRKVIFSPLYPQFFEKKERAAAVKILKQLRSISFNFKEEIMSSIILEKEAEGKI